MSKEVKTTENISHKVLIEPHITEASTVAAEMNKYVFKVAPRATKKQVEKAVKELYGVAVTSVRTINVIGKARTRGRVTGRTPGFKKAIVTVKEGESIDLFGTK